MNSGLMVVHRDGRPRKTSFAQFARSVGEDCLSVKGVMGSRLRHKGLQILVINTHLQADSLFGFYDPVRTRAQQLDQVQQFMADSVEPTDDIVIVSGDFNHNLVAHRSARYLPGWQPLPCQYRYRAKQCLLSALDHAYAMCRPRGVLASNRQHQHRLIVEQLPLQQCSDHNPILVHLLERDEPNPDFAAPPLPPAQPQTAPARNYFVPS